MGISNVVEMELKVREQFIKLFHFRVANGTGVGLVNTEFKVIKPRMYHYSKEAVESMVTTFITPKGSPLQVFKRTIGLLETIPILMKLVLRRSNFQMQLCG